MDSHTMYYSDIMYLPIYLEPSVQLEEFVDSFASNPSYLMQIIPKYNVLRFLPACGDEETISIQLDYFAKDRSRDEYDRLSKFCSKFNMLSSIASVSDPGKATFTLEVHDASTNSVFKNAVKVMIVHFEIEDFNGDLLDNLFYL